MSDRRDAEWSKTGWDGDAGSSGGAEFRMGRKDRRRFE